MSAVVEKVEYDDETYYYDELDYDLLDEWADDVLDSLFFEFGDDSIHSMADDFDEELWISTADEELLEVYLSDDFEDDGPVGQAISIDSRTAQHESAEGFPLDDESHDKRKVRIAHKGSILNYDFTSTEFQTALQELHNSMMFSTLRIATGIGSLSLQDTIDIIIEGFDGQLFKDIVADLSVASKIYTKFITERYVNFFRDRLLDKILSASQLVAIDTMEQ